MNCQTRISTDQPHPNARLALDSTLIEKALEYQLVGAIMARLLARGQRYEVLQGICDRDGYDIVIDAGGTMRHIQFKAMVEGGKRDRIALHTRLATKPSGCAILIEWDLATIAPCGFRFFGDLPGKPLPDLGDKVARHSRGNALGDKGKRAAHREVSIKRFQPVVDFNELIDRLFGSAPDPIRQLLTDHLADEPVSGDEPWLEAVRQGDFDAVELGLDWQGSSGLAHLIDGYALLATLGIADTDAFLTAQEGHAEIDGSWPGDAAQLWATLFLEHRRWRFCDPHGPDDHQQALLDQLVRQLSEELRR